MRHTAESGGLLLTMADSSSMPGWLVGIMGFQPILALVISLLVMLLVQTLGPVL